MAGAKRYMELVLIVFVKEVSLGANGPFGMKMAHVHNSGSTLRIFLKFGIMKGVKWHMKLKLIVFSKKCLVLPTLSKNFSKFCTLKESKRLMKIIFKIFPKKVLLGANGPFWGKIGLITLDAS